MLRLAFTSAVLLGFLSSAPPRADAAAPLPPFRDLRELIRTNVLQVTDEQFDQAAGEALLGLVHGRLLEPGEIVNEESDAPAIAEKRRLAPGCLYVRIGQVTLGLAPQLAVVLKDPELTTNTLGLILDLRFAGGTEYAGAATTANLFTPDAGPLLDWGTGHADGTEKSDAWVRPVTVLVNGDTRGAAEALAGVLRLQKSALILGSRTSGTAAIFREVPLADGRRLRLAAAGVRTGDGQPLPATGLAPDIGISLKPELERAYLADPYGSPSPANLATAGARSTNALASSSSNSNSNSMAGAGLGSAAGASRHRLNEAELVRARKAGEPLDSLAATINTLLASTVPEPPPSIHDPVLARAVDILQGLQLMKPGNKQAAP